MDNNNIINLAAIGLIAYYFFRKKNDNATPASASDENGNTYGSRELKNGTYPVRDYSGPLPGDVRYIQNRLVQ